MNRMRDVQRQTSFQLLAQDLEGQLSVEALADQLSALADMLLAQTLACVWPLVRRGEFATDAAPRFAIIAYGKLGGKELGYNSDLDLVFLYDDARADAADVYARLARRVMSWLSTMTSSGRLYDADLRLRPDGNAGLLAVPVAAFAQYQRDHAWVWEHQALTRARACAGVSWIAWRTPSSTTKSLPLPCILAKRQMAAGVGSLAAARLAGVLRSAGVSCGLRAADALRVVGCEGLAVDMACADRVARALSV